jgi:predicted patatin/cPLA2 family phospholipase
MEDMVDYYRKQNAYDLVNNVKDTALIIEGGGMKACFTGGIIYALLLNGVKFSYVSGSSAGANHAVNYVSRDILKIDRNFVDDVDFKEFGGRKSFFKGHGFFDSDKIFARDTEEGDIRHYHFDNFKNNPAQVTVSAFNCLTGETEYWTKEDMPNIKELMLRVRASSTLPIIMNKTKIDDNIYFDGGLGEGGGLLIDKAIRDGYKKFFIILSNPRGFKLEEPNHQLGIKLAFRRYPKLVDAILNRHEEYNKALDLIDRLEDEGKALVVRPKTEICSLNELDMGIIAENFIDAMYMAQSNMKDWREFLEI